MRAVRYTYESMGKCLCYKGGCPTFKANNLSGGLFCALGKYETPPERKGCPCDSCPVWIECGLAGLYFCIEGAFERDTS